MAVVWRVFEAAKDRLGMRLVHWAVQRDHLHLVVEPESGRALSRAMQGLCTRFAKQLNTELRRRGGVFGDRFHAVVLGSPQQVRNAIAYVLLQERHHATDRGEPPPVGLDPCSSAPCFDGWTVAYSPRAGPWTTTVMPPSTWLLGVGWKRHGLVNPSEVPGLRRR